MAPGFDRLMTLLMDPRVRRLRRWSFVLTVPVAVLVLHVFGVRQAALVVAVRVLLWVGVAVLAWRLGSERGDALRDLLMHPRVRAFTRAEVDVLTALPRLLLAGPRAAGTTYHRRTFGLPLALAFTPVMLAEAGAVHLLLAGGLVAWVVAALHAYALMWLWGFALGPRAYPHRIDDRRIVLRGGALYRAAVVPEAIARVDVRPVRVPGEAGLVARDDAVLIPAGNRVDVWIEFAEPVRVQRPLGDSLVTHRIAVASDDPQVLAAALTARPRTALGAVRSRRPLVAGLELGDVALGSC